MSAKTRREMLSLRPIRNGKILHFCENEFMDNPFSIDLQIILVQAIETVQTSEVEHFLSSRSLKPGDVFHLISTAYKHPEILRIVTSSGKNIQSSGFNTQIGSPLVALTSLVENWCAVLCDDPKGHIIEEGFKAGDGWKSGTIFVAVYNH